MFQKEILWKAAGKIEDVILMRPEVDEDMLEELEEALITSDIGMDTTEKIIRRLRDDVKRMNIRQPEGVKGQIKISSVNSWTKGKPTSSPTSLL